MKRSWPYYLSCLIVPHIMIIVGLVFMTRGDLQKKVLGKRICVVSTAVLAIGSLFYYIFFTPYFGMD